VSDASEGYTQSRNAGSMVQEDILKTNSKLLLKRRVGYSEEKVSATWARLSSLVIDEEDSIQENLLPTA
jgi:hypothetical protein